MFKVRPWSMRSNIFIIMSSVIRFQGLVQYAHAQKRKSMSMPGNGWEFQWNTTSMPVKELIWNFYTPMKITQRKKKKKKTPPEGKKNVITLPVPVTVTNWRDNNYSVKQNNPVACTGHACSCVTFRCHGYAWRHVCVTFRCHGYAWRHVSAVRYARFVTSRAAVV